jgi:hypothetical protein
MIGNINNTEHDNIQHNVMLCAVFRVMLLCIFMLNVEILNFVVEIIFDLSIVCVIIAGVIKMMENMLTVFKVIIVMLSVIS